MAKRVLSYDERVLGRTITKSVSPLPGRATEEEDIAPAASPPLTRSKSAPVSATPPPTPRPKAPALQKLDRRTRQRVARGRELIDARFDLHGLTQAEAHAALSRFLHAASARGARLVLIITGKGSRGSEGVLKRQVPHWLALPEFRDRVIGFEEAHVAHGGEGALYVRLRRWGGDDTPS